jgi:hypothetical protein
LKGQEVVLKDKSYFSKSTGDEAATRALGMGVVTHTITGKVYFNSWSMDVKIEGENVVRTADLTTHNHMSVPGNTPPWPYVDGVAAGARPARGLPRTCKDAPVRVALPRNVNRSMKNSYKNSFPGGTSQERTGTLIRDRNGRIKVVNEKSGTSGSCYPNRSVGAGQTVIGTYHTHPYDASEGGHKGVSFSGSDIAFAKDYKEPILVAAGTKQFMIVPTKRTRGTSEKISAEWEKEFQKRLKKGQSIQRASAGATMRVARKHDMAYYEGSNGTLKRVSC